METIGIVIVAISLMLIALVGIIIPFLPGVPLAWIGLFAYAYFTNFQAISLKASLIFLGLTAATMILDFIAPIIGAKKFQATKYGILGASLGLFLGVITFGPFGALIGPLVGAFIGESLKGAEFEKASKSAFGTFIGFLAGSVVKIVVVLTMLGFLIASLF